MLLLGEGIKGDFSAMMVRSGLARTLIVHTRSQHASSAMVCFVLEERAAKSY